MTLPTGAISMSQVNSELQRSATQNISMNDGQVRQLAGRGSGAISMGDLRGKSWLTFSDVPGEVYGTNVVDFTISANMPVTWTFNAGRANASINSGASATSVTFTLRAIRQSGQWAGVSTNVNVTATGYGIQRNWTVQMVAEGDGGWINPDF